ncbi:MAG: hypothetical protein JSU07_05045 [Bacteroidetes bacterium]|nr:hypothetical protein [Bacteroidota bacterium]
MKNIPNNKINDVTVIKSEKHSNFTISLRSDGILQFDIYDDIEFSYADAVELIDILETFGEGKKCKNLYIIGKHCSAKMEAIQYFSSDASLPFTAADALVIQSLAQRLLGNFLVKLIRSKWPIRLFTEKEKAEEWLLSIKEE